ncbi:MAG: C2 family cysteine protease [Myxococcota bacterium]
MSLAARGLLAAFDRIDASPRDGRLSGAELDAAIQDPAVTGELSDAVVAARAKLLRDEYPDVGRTYFSYGWGYARWLGTGVYALGSSFLRGTQTLSRSELERWANGRGSGDMAKLDEDLERVTTRRAATPAQTFAAAAPRAGDVRQGFVGDCYLQAAAAGLAAMRPQELSRLITELPDGGYSVRFGKISVDVSALTDSESSYFASSGANGRWLAVISKAYAQYRFGSKTPKRGETLNAADGGLAEEGIVALTGHSATSYSVWWRTLASTRQILTEGIAKRRVMVAGSGFDSDKVHASHAYTVIAYDRASDQITLRNPWGTHRTLTGPGLSADGNVTMSLAEFASTFAVLAVEDAS